MNVNIDRYLTTLLSYTPGHKRGSRIGGDYVSLIHVPVAGPEEVYSVAFGEKGNFLSHAKYRETIWKYLESCDANETVDIQPLVNVLQAEVDPSHPVFKFIDLSLLRRCENRNDGCSGLDYYLLMWQKDGCASVVECWEPYGRNIESWITLIGAMQVLTSQYEYAMIEAGV